MTDSFEALAAKGHANDLQAALDRALAGNCPTACEEDCEAGCHEGHKPTPGHDPSTCPGHLSQELAIQELRHAPFHELFEEAMFWRQFGEVAQDVIGHMAETSSMYSTRLREIQHITQRSAPATISKDDVKGWHMAMNSVLVLVMAMPDNFEAAMEAASRTSERLTDMIVRRERDLQEASGE